jgi:hypothetical protein
MAAPADLPTSPELVLVAPPEEAELARRSLPLPVPPIPRFPTFPPAPVRARAHRAERSWTYAVAAAVLVAFAIAAALVLNRSSAEPGAPAARTAAAPPTVTHPAPAKPRPTTTAAPRPTTTAATAPARTTSTPRTTTRTSTPRTTTKPKPAPKGFVPSRVFAWPAKPDAVAYVIRFFRGNKLVFQRRTEQPRITLPESFEFAPGSYRWLVVPVDRRGNEGKALVASQFDVGR